MSYIGTSLLRPITSTDNARTAQDAFRFWFGFIGVLRDMERYFSHICDGTNMQGD